MESGLLQESPEGYSREIVSGESRPEVESIVSALQPFSSGLEADGYSLQVRLADGDGLHLEIVAGSDACEDCLIPKEMFRPMIASTLNSQGLAFEQITLVYPNDRD